MGAILGATGSRAHAEQEQRAEDERGGVERERLAGTETEDQGGGERGADQKGDVGHRLGQRSRVLDQRLGDRLGQQSAVGGLKERPAPRRTAPR